VEGEEGVLFLFCWRYPLLHDCSLYFSRMGPNMPGGD